MKKRITSLALATTLGLAGVTGGVVLAPSIASAATTQTSVAAEVSDRVTQIRETLAGLVTDGSITAEQADEVASTLAETLPRDGHGGPGRGGRVSLDAAADVLGLSADELRTQLEAGASLASVAADQGVARDALVAELVEPAQSRLAEAVESGRITQEEADEKAADLTERVTAQVDREGLPIRGGRPGGGPAAAA